MHPKQKYIEAVNGAIDFIENAVDGADEDQNESEMLNALRELLDSMLNSQHRKRVSYFVSKASKSE